jgi:NitT/TauT family transport system ATP-binding protein
METLPAIEIDRLNLQFQAQSIYRDLSLTIKRNEFACIVGPSGCGKSTLLRVIGGLLGYDGGTVAVNGMPPAQAWEGMSYVFQSPRLVPWRDAVENVMLGAELRQKRPDRVALRTRALDLLDLIGLSQEAAKFPAMLSGGERQRVAIARALLVDPDIILMDEPFSALDLNTRARLRSEISSIWSKTDKTVVFVTHDVEEAVLLADRIIVLSGKPTRVRETIMIEHARPRDLRADATLMQIRRDLEDTMREMEAHAPMSELTFS